MKKILFISIISQAILNTGNSFECGEYKISGIGRMLKNTPVLIINERSLSEYVFTIPISEQPRIVPYIDRPFELHALIVKKGNGTRGELKDLKEISLRVPNPLSESPDTGIKLLHKLPCQK
jgi:hypothetical protein